MNYATHRIEDRAKREIFRSYLSDALKNIAENTAKYAGGNYPTARYADRVKPRKVDNRSGEEIAVDVIKKCGLKVVS